MILGTVKGNIVSTRKCSNLVGFKLLLIEPYYGNKAEIFVAADTM
ncbi:MAG: EutN/CcmL family microcompartment protein, partial [Acetivibrio sp.]